MMLSSCFTTASPLLGYYIPSGWTHVSGHNVSKVLIGSFDPSSALSSTSIWTMTQPGHKPSYPYIMRGSGFAEQNSLNQPPSWHLLLAAHPSSNRFSQKDFATSLTRQSWRLSMRGVRGTTSHLSHPQRTQSRGCGMVHAYKPTLKIC